MVRTRIAVASAAVVVALAGCSSDTSTSTPAGDGEQTVAVTLQEFAVSAVPTSVAAGEVTFEATNDGPDDQHELVVIRTDLDPTALPTNDDGSVDEEGEGVEVLDETWSSTPVPPRR